MKKNVLFTGLLLIVMSLNAQTTHNLDWFTNIGSNVDLTIEAGDEVIWTWLNPNHTVENIQGSSVETFDSGFLGPTNSTFSYTFTVVGDNDYFCSIHGAPSMSGTITVLANLGIDEEIARTFDIEKNPVDANLNITLSQPISEGKIIIYDLLGKAIISEKIANEDSISLDVSDFNKGLYLVTIISENGIETKRFVKN